MKSKNSPALKKALPEVITTPIAIIGMSALFPQARTLPEYWNNILNKIDAMIDIPASRWNPAEYYDPDPAAIDKTYCKRGGFIPDVDFDPTEFGLPPNLLEVTDVSQLLSLVVAKECLADAGYTDEQKDFRDRTGVVLGMVGIGSKLAMSLISRLQYPVWEKVLRSYGISEEDTQQIIDKIRLAYPNWEENSFPGLIGNVIAGRIANRLDLGGTNCVVDAACGSSLAAVRSAVSELIEGRADMMITGGVDTDNSIGTFMCFSKTPAFSKNDHVRPFDQDSDGMLAGEGIGMVLLKRLADAERDGDRIYAVIKAVGTSSDGRFKSIYAPRPAGQASALRRAYQEAGYPPSTVGLIEAHGTGTMAGDPAEFEGLNEVFSENNPEKQTIALGSVKSQIGHTKAAAGVASLIKTSLALYHKVLPPTINVKKPNAKLGIENTPFYLNTECRPWIRPAAHPRRAGVSSFGFGGTNFHVALEEFEADHTRAYRVQAVPKVILVSAAAPSDLLVKCQALSEKMLSAQCASEFSNLAAAAQATPIPQREARIGFVAANAGEAHSQLTAAVNLLKNIGTSETAEGPSGVYYRRSGVDPRSKLVALFPGQGSQYVNMGRELAVNFPPIRRAFAEMDSAFAADRQAPLTRTVYPIPVFDSAEVEKQNQRLTLTENAQPAIGTLSLGMYQIFKQAGFVASFTAGHSFGELTALCAAGVLDETGFYALAKARGKAMAASAGPNIDAGTMVAVKGDVAQIEVELRAFPEVTLANRNSKNQVVLAGGKAAVAAVQKALTEKGFSVVPLTVSAAFHTPLVAYAQQPFAEAVEKVKFNRPAVAVYSNTTGEEYGSDPNQIRKTLTEHMLRPVLFKDEIEAIYAQGGAIFVEFGPKNVLTNLVKNILEGKPHHAVAVNANPKKDSDRQLREAAAQLYVLGLDLRNIDPYALPEKAAPERKKSSVTVKLNGGLYLTEKTRAAFEQAISQKNSLTGAGNAPQPAALPASPAFPAAQTPLPVAMTKPEAQPEPTKAADPVEDFQNEAVKAHTQFLINDSEYVRGFTQLAQQELSLLAGQSSPQALEQINIALQTLERGLDQFHAHQAETLRVHELYLQNQAQLTGQALRVIGAPGSVDLTAQPVQAQAAVAVSVPSARVQPASLVAPAAASIPSNPAPHLEPPVQPAVGAPAKAKVNLDEIQQVLIGLVSEKTGYPPEMLDLEMDMEADLGIDSIKRVEIMGAIQAQYPDLPKMDPSALSEMRTLGHVVDYALAGFDAAIQPSEPPTAGQPSEKTVTSTGTTAPSEIKGGFLEVVSEKTGYPIEMLELDMDLEADLGIDSIKRVEILGAIQTQYPDLPQIDLAALSELHTLGEITNALSAAQPGGAAVVVAVHETSQPAQMQTSRAVEEIAAPAQPSLPAEEIERAFLSVVSEKTGYPVEMLELDMDMEADLGIDSIKRVEILGAMQANYPGLAQIEPSGLAELHTLRQIVDSFVPQVSVDPTPATPAGEQVSGLPRGVVRLKPIPAPDRIDLAAPNGNICLVMDDGGDLTITLVEKLSAEGKQVVVLRLPENLAAQRLLPGAVRSVQLPDTSETSIQKTLDDLQKQYGPAAVFVHLDLKASAADNHAEREEAVVKIVFLVAKYLKENLNAAAKDGFAAFMTVTHLDGKIGLAPASMVDPMSGAFFGLVKTLNLEWEQVHCRAVDLTPELDSRVAADLILAEMHDPNRLISEVGYHAGKRFTLAVGEPGAEA